MEMKPYQTFELYADLVLYGTLSIFVGILLMLTIGRTSEDFAFIGIACFIFGSISWIVYCVLKGKTPSEACGIEIEGENKWRTLIENASLASQQPKGNTKKNLEDFV